MQGSQINRAWLFRTHGESNSEDVNTWPELCQENQMKHSTRKSTHASYSCYVKDETNIEEDNTISLDNSEYPELGEAAVRNKNSATVDKFSCLSDPIINMFVPEEDNMDGRKSKAGKRYKRTDKICINLQEALESTRCLLRVNGKEILKLKRNVPKGIAAATIPSVTDKEINPEAKKIKISISRDKRSSKLKRIILLHRNRKTQINIEKREAFESEKMEAISKDVNAINFNALKITTNPEIDYVKRMSRLTFFDKDYRNSMEGDLPESSVYHRPDVTQKLNDLHLRVKHLPIKVANNNTDRTISAFCEDIIENDILQRTFSLELNADNKEGILDNPMSDDKNLLKYSRNFREYCTNTLTPGLNESLEKFVHEITRLQKKQYERNPNKAKYRRRYYSGLKEVRKHVETRKLKFVIIAPDVEKVELEDGLNDQVYKLLDACKKQNVIFCFGLRRRKLGYYTHGKGLVGCIGVANYTGTEEIFQNALIELVHARNAFKKLNGQNGATIDLSKVISEDYLLSERVGALMKILSPSCVQN